MPKRGIAPVKELPALDQSLFVDLPADFDKHRYLMSHSKWLRHEEESLAGYIMTAVARRHKWEAVPWTDIASISQSGDAIMHGIESGLGEIAWNMVDTGDIEIILFNGMVYLVPTKVFTDTINQSKVRYF